LGKQPRNGFLPLRGFAFPLFLRLLKRDDEKEALWLMRGAVLLRRVFSALLLREWRKAGFDAGSVRPGIWDRQEYRVAATLFSGNKNPV